MKSLTRVVVLTFSLAAGLFGLHLKVASVDSKKGEVKLLLPMHFTMIDARVATKGERIRLEPNRFYDANIIPKSGGKYNLLRVKIPHQKPARFFIQKISFHRPVTASLPTRTRVLNPSPGDDLLHRTPRPPRLTLACAH